MRSDATSVRLPAWVPTDILIDGKWVSAADGSDIAILDPATGDWLASIPNAGIAEADQAVDAAARSLEGWAKTSPRARSELLRRAFEVMTARTDELADLIVLENGKARADALAEVAYAADFFRWYSEESVRLLGTSQAAPAGQNRILVNRRPVGVCVLITPWNFPAAMATRKIAPALAAGCSVVLKPSEQTPLTALAIARILCDIGIPPGVVNVLTTLDAEPVVHQMLKDPRVRKLSFTGSTRVGRHLLATAADYVLNCSMELGGNAPFIVLDDADLDRAVREAMTAKMRNGGCACTAANRFFVHSSLVEEFTKRLTARLVALRVGHGLSDGVQLGSLVDESTRDKVHDLVTRSVAHGAKVKIGGVVPDGRGWFYLPTVLVDVPLSAPVMHEEIFGPVVPIAEFSDDDEVVKRANDTEYGLVAYLFTKDLARAFELADRLDFGMVGINRGVVSDPAAPFGGMKQSGIGREGAHEGLLEFTEPQYLAVGN